MFANHVARTLQLSQNFMILTHFCRFLQQSSPYIFPSLCPSPYTIKLPNSVLPSFHWLSSKSTLTHLPQMQSYYSLHIFISPQVFNHLLINYSVYNTRFLISSILILFTLQCLQTLQKSFGI